MANRITDLLEDLVTCLCAQLVTDGLPNVCVCSLSPGESVSLDYAGDCADACGQAWVRLATGYPSTSIGVPSTTPGNCSLGIGTEVELGIARCIEVGDEQGNPAPPEALTAAAQLQYDDMLAMWRAVACCRSSKDWILGAYTPFGPEGGMVGGTLAVAVLVT